MSNLVIDFKPSALAQNTDAILVDQGYTYNQAGLTYNQAGVEYGGIQNNRQDIIPEVSLAQNITPSIITSKNNNFSIPTMNLAENIRPDIFGFSDIYTSPPPSNSGMLMGILGLTYP